MRRTLTLAAVAVAAVASFSPIGTASAAPDCDIFQNCVCTTVNGVTTRVTGYSYLHCV